jgi:hypothetical protein
LIKEENEQEEDVFDQVSIYHNNMDWFLLHKLW